MSFEYDVEWEDNFSSQVRPRKIGFHRLMKTKKHKAVARKQKSKNKKQGKRKKRKG